MQTDIMMQRAVKSAGFSMNNKGMLSIADATESNINPHIPNLRKASVIQKPFVT